MSITHREMQTAIATKLTQLNNDIDSWLSEHGNVTVVWSPNGKIVFGIDGVQRAFTLPISTYMNKVEHTKPTIKVGTYMFYETADTLTCIHDKNTVYIKEPDGTTRVVCLTTDALTVLKTRTTTTRNTVTYPGKGDISFCFYNIDEPEPMADDDGEDEPEINNNEDDDIPF